MSTHGNNSSLLKKIVIELPHYSYGHAAPSEASGGFVGRKKVLKKFKELIQDEDDKVGVYLVTGNRGVGKTKLIDEVEKMTSLDPVIVDKVKHLFILFCAVAGTQFCLSDELLRPVITFIWKFFQSTSSPDSFVKETVHWVRRCIYALCPVSFFALLYMSEFRRRGNLLKELRFSVLKEFLFYRWAIGSCRNTRYLFRVMFFVGLTQIVARLFENCGWNVTATQGFLVCLSATAVLYIVYIASTKASWMFGKIVDVVEGHRRVFLRINFGHALKDERDILRLIARGLLSEYRKYHQSFWRLFVWRATALVFLFIFAGVFGGIMRETGVWRSVKDWVKDEKRLSDGDYAAYIKHKNTKLDSGGEVVAEVDSGDKEIYLMKEFFGVAWVKRSICRADSVIEKVTRKAEKLPMFLWKGVAKDQAGGHPDYPFWISFVFLYGCFVALFRTDWVSRYFVTHRMVMRRLEDLNKDITHGTEREWSAAMQGSADVGAKVGGKVKRTRGLADAREIERVLQDIFQDIRRIPTIMGRPKFVVVFDELDKVEPGDAEAVGVGPVSKAALFSIDAARKRQAEVLKIMSNMKYFLSTSEAKFVFIAGREMYDIYLADASDRNNYIGSIFSAVIEVNSFLTDHAEGADRMSMTSLTEEFVCRRLLPCGYVVKDGEYNLRKYQEYLEKEIFRKKADNADVGEEDLKIRKVIAVLERFVVFLAHVSKGAPKKMGQLFESFIDVHHDDEDADEKEDGFIRVQYYHRSKIFLSFGYRHQYTLSLIAYLVTPIFYRLVAHNVSMHNDKLLVSSLRFVDFLFKFHKHSFMWKHLDISPEILEVNKSPELRLVAADLLGYMTQMHITKSNFSLFDYRFDSRIATEIFAATRIDEQLSALFSFSLDETLPLKKHYQDLLAETRKEYRNDNRSVTDDFIDSIASLQTVLGDLHYFDGELEEAGMYYRDAVESLRKFESKDGTGARRNGKAAMGPEQLYLFVRNMLKLGMIYETRKQNEQAYLIYGEVCARIIRERNIAIGELGAGVVVRKRDDKIGFVKESDAWGKEANKEKQYKEEQYNDNVEYLRAPEGTMITGSKAQLSPLYFRRLSPNANDALFRKMTYEGVKQLYLPFLAKLQIIEKSHMGGIARTHLEQFDKEFELLTFIIDHDEANILEADFYSRAADILFYKNSDLKGKKNKTRTVDGDEDKCAETAAPKNSDEKVIPENSSCTACHYYHKAVCKLLNMGMNPNYDNEGKHEYSKGRKDTAVTQLLSKCVENLNDENYCNINMKFCAVLARVLSDWGNVFLSCDVFEKENEKNTWHDGACGCYIGDGMIIDGIERNDDPAFLRACFSYVHSEMGDGGRNILVNMLKSVEREFSKKEIAFVMYALSFHAFHRMGKYKRSAFQVYKMLRLFKRYKMRDNKDEIEKLSRKAISLLWFSAEEQNALELNKTRKDFGIDNGDGKKEALRYILTDSDADIIAVLENELRLELEIKKDDETGNEGRINTLKKLRELNVASPYDVMYSMTARIFRLRLRADINFETYKMLIPHDKFVVEIEEKRSRETVESIKEKIREEVGAFIRENGDDATMQAIYGKNNKKTPKERFEELVSDSIFCLKEIVLLSQTLGESYLFNHRFMAVTHRRLSFWADRYEAYKDINNDDDVNRMKKRLHGLLGDGWKEKLSAQYERKQALMCYNKSLEMHREGKAYHTMIDSMYFVKDDYNDRSDHFSIAIERNRLVNGEMERRIQRLEAMCEKDDCYEAEHYI
jgi:hypothetical protein